MADRADSDISEEITFAEIWRYMRLGWRSFAFLLAVGVLIGLLAVLIYPRKYTATVFVSPVSGSSDSLASKLGEGMSAVAGITGLDIGKNGPVTPFQQFQVLMGSEIFARNLEHKYGFLKEVYPYEWDAQNRRMEPRTSILHRASDFLTGRGDGPRDSHDLADYLSSRVVLQKVAETGIYKLTYSNRNPEVAQRLLLAVVLELNDMIRRRLVANSDITLNYLDDRLRHIDAIDLRASLINLYSSQEQKRMMLNSGQASAGEILDGVSISGFPDSPSNLMLIAVPIALSIAIGLFFAFVEGQQRAKGTWRPIGVRMRTGTDRGPALAPRAP